MKNLIRFKWAWLALAASIAFGVLVCPGCGDKPTVKPGVVVETPKKPEARMIPDSEFCKTIAPLPKTSRAVGMRGRYWDIGQTLRVKLLAGTAQQRAFFTNVVLESQKYINLNVSYVTTGDADIRVSFVTGGGSWSYVGRDALSVPQNYATLNLGWLGSDVAMHEWLHAVAMSHEQSSPNSDIDWNKPVVYAALMGPPNNWTKEQVDFNVFRKLTAAEAEATVFDPTGIGQYSIPASWAFNYPNGIPGGKVLSALDISFWSAKYPKSTPPPPPPPTTYTVTKAQRDNIKRITLKAKTATDAAKVATDSLKIITDQIFGAN